MKKTLFRSILLILVFLFVAGVETKKVRAAWEDPVGCWGTYPIELPSSRPPRLANIDRNGWCFMILGTVGNCCYSGYMCDIDALATANQLAAIQCKPIPPVPTNECKLTSLGVAGGGLYLEADCSVGQVCPSGGAGTCVSCSSANPGICYKQRGSGTLNSCCSGYMCPDTLNTGVNTCVKGSEKVATLLRTINGIVLPLAVILGMILIIHNGYKLMTSQGDPTKLQEGKDGLTSAIIGLIFVLMAVSILRVIIKALITGNADPFS
jgi:hypothetical protein